MNKAYAQLAAIGRDTSLEENAGLRLRAPSEAEISELQRLLGSAAEFLGAEPRFSPLPEFVLEADLDKEQRALVDAAYIPRYAAAIEADEAPRESFTFAECGERMVDLRLEAEKRKLEVVWSSRPFAAACGSFAGRPRIFWLRESVAQALFRAIEAFRHIDLRVCIEDCFRPLEVQAGLYRARVAAIRKESPFLSETEVLREAAAKTACAPYRAAHMGGAAVDFTLRDAEGRPLDLGNPYPTGGAATILDFPYVTWAQLRTRRLFAEVSRMTGLLPYPGEDWHVSQGDGLAAIMEGETVVRYCAIRDFDRLSGAVIPFEPDEARRRFPIE